jgi:hypothetical protein
MWVDSGTGAKLAYTSTERGPITIRRWPTGVDVSHPLSPTEFDVDLDEAKVIRNWLSKVLDLNDGEPYPAEVADVLTPEVTLLPSGYAVGATTFITESARYQQKLSNDLVSWWTVVTELTMDPDKVALVVQGDAERGIPQSAFDPYWPVHWSTADPTGPGSVFESKETVVLTGGITADLYTLVEPDVVQQGYRTPLFKYLMTWVNEELRIAIGGTSTIGTPYDFEALVNEYLAATE